MAFAFVLFYACVMLFAHVPSWEYTRPEGWAMDDGELDQDCETEGNKTLGTFQQVCTTEWNFRTTSYVETCRGKSFQPPLTEKEEALGKAPPDFQMPAGGVADPDDAGEGEVESVGLGEWLAVGRRFVRFWSNSQ